LLNNLSLYAHTKQIQVQVVDEKGSVVQGALVDFEVMNYAEFYPIASVWTDGEGKAALTTGLGLIHIHVSYEGSCAEAMLDVREKESIVVVLSPAQTMDSWIDQDMIAPVDAPIHPLQPTATQKQEGKQKFKQATDKRLAKVEAFFSQTTSEERDRVELARGNYEEVKSFLEDTQSEHLGQWKEALLSQLTAKDFRDCQRGVLLEHLEYAMKYRDEWPEDVFVSYVLSPRVQLEPLTTYRKFVETYYTAEQKQAMKMNPKLIWEQVQERVVSQEDKEYPNIITSPEGCLEVGVGSLLSKKILFVAICRTLGIPARLSEIDGTMEYMEGSQFVPVIQTQAKEASVILKGGSEGQVWTYSQNWSIARLVEGRYTTLNLANKGWEDNQLRLSLEAGQYRIITANRLPNGNIFAKTYTFELTLEAEQTIALSLREAKLHEMLEEVEIPDFRLFTKEGDEIFGRDFLKASQNLVMWLEESKEPTEHIFNEILEKPEVFKELREQIIFVFRNQEALKDPTVSKVLNVLGDVMIYYDDFEENVNTLARRMYVDPDKLPLIMITKEGLKGIYATSGYNVGSGDMIIRILKDAEVQ
ncbi:MAG: transglutaminase domain-containing protein, partial [Cellulosilyticaceae bacterium]